MTTGRFEGRVAFITGVARGQGRNHAVRFAREGAAIIGVDSCEDVATVGYPLASRADLAETVSLVEAAGGRILASVADVRSLPLLTDALEAGVAEFGRLDVVVANAGISSSAEIRDMSPQMWQDMIDINLTGVWNTVKASVAHLRAPTASVILVSSIAGLKGLPLNAHYTAAKHGLVGLVRSLAQEFSGHGIRINSVHPTNVDTPMVYNDALYQLFFPGVENPTREMAEPLLATLNALPVACVDVEDVSNAVLFLASDEARYITGATLPVDAGALIK